jgi:hypothetical protein
MMNETPNPSARRRVAIGAGFLAFAIVAYVEFVSPSLQSRTREVFGYREELQLEMLTSRSPLLRRVVHSEARLSGKGAVVVRSQGAYVYEELWTKREKLREFSRMCWTQGKSESNVLFSLLLIISLKTRDEDLNRLLTLNRPA